MKYVVRYSVTFETEIVVSEGEEISDVISDIDIPENEDNTYVSGTIEYISIKDESGKELPTS